LPRGYEIVESLSRLSLPSLAGGRVSMGTLLSYPGVVLHVDGPSERVALHWAQLAPKIASMGYRVVLAFAGSKAWRLGGSLRRAPVTVLIDEDFRLARLLGAVKRLPLIGLRLGVEPVTLVVSRGVGGLRVEVARGAGDGFSHTLWVLEAVERLGGRREG